MCHVRPSAVSALSYKNVNRHEFVLLHIARQWDIVIQQDLSQFKVLCNISQHANFYGEFQDPHPLPKLKGHASFWLPIYLSVPSIFEFHLLNLQPEGMPCWGDRSPLNTFSYSGGSSLVRFLIVFYLNSQNSSHYPTTSQTK